jgi:uncharacterized damage-inducible protein DinB
MAHEGHHRGQIVMIARQLGYCLPVEITGGLWQWSKRTEEARSQISLTPNKSSDRSADSLYLNLLYN